MLLVYPNSWMIVQWGYKILGLRLFLFKALKRLFFIYCQSIIIDTSLIVTLWLKLCIFTFFLMFFISIFFFVCVVFEKQFQPKGISLPSLLKIYQLLSQTTVILHHFLFCFLPLACILDVPWDFSTCSRKVQKLYSLGSTYPFMFQVYCYVYLVFELSWLFRVSSFLILSFFFCAP